LFVVLVVELFVALFVVASSSEHANTNKVANEIINTLDIFYSRFLRQERLMTATIAKTGA